MKLFAVVAQFGDEPEFTWTVPGVLRQPHDHAMQVYRQMCSDRYTMRLAEFVEVATAPTDRPPPNTEVPADSLHGPGGTGC